MTDEISPLQLVLNELQDFRKETNAKIEALDHAIRGNGKPGLKQRVSDLEKYVRVIAIATLVLVVLNGEAVISVAKKHFGL